MHANMYREKLYNTYEKLLYMFKKIPIIKKGTKYTKNLKKTCT